MLGLPSGGVPVALKVATALDPPLDVIVVRKLGVRIVNDEDVRMAGIFESDLATVEASVRVELDRRARRFVATVRD